MNFEVDIDESLLEEKINISFRKFFNIQNFSIQLKEDVDDLNWFFNEEFSPRIDENFSVQFKNGHTDLNELFRKDFYTPKKTSFDVGLRYNSFHLNQIHLNESSHLNQSFSKFFDVETFDFLLDESKNINDSLFEEYFKIREIIEQPNIEVAVEQVVKKYFETNLDQTKNVTDLIFEEYFELKQQYDYDNIQKLRQSLDNGEILSKEDKEEFLQIESLSCVENEKTKNFNEEFEKFFEVTRTRLDLSTLQNLKPQKVDIVEPEPVLEKLIVEVEEPFPFRVCLNEKNFIYDCEFRKHFKIHNFKTCVDRSKNIDDLVFEEHFKIKKQPEYDYNIIENLKKDLNSRKIVTREERESVVLNEPEVSVLEDAKESIELNVEETTSIIKDNRFYKIVETDIPKHIEPEIDTSYKEEVEQQLSSMESKYEDLLQKTKHDYESKLGKMINDFSDFRNHITHQVTRMSYISSSSAGGGAVRILDMDDVDASQLADGRTLMWDSESNKFKLESARAQTAQVYEVDSEILSVGYVDLDLEAASELYDLSTVELNGLVNYHNFHYTFISSTRVDISSLGARIGDFIRVIYTRK